MECFLGFDICRVRRLVAMSGFLIILKLSGIGFNEIKTKSVLVGLVLACDFLVFCLTIYVAFTWQDSNSSKSNA